MVSCSIYLFSQTNLSSDNSICVTYASRVALSCLSIYTLWPKIRLYLHYEDVLQTAKKITSLVATSRRLSSHTFYCIMCYRRRRRLPVWWLPAVGRLLTCFTVLCVTDDEEDYQFGGYQPSALFSHVLLYYVLQMMKKITSLVATSCRPFSHMFYCIMCYRWWRRLPVWWLPAVGRLFHWVPPHIQEISQVRLCNYLLSGNWSFII